MNLPVRLTGAVLVVALFCGPRADAQLTASQLVDASWAPVETGPVFQGREGHWDAKIRERGWILIDQGIWKLWYTGYQAEPGSPMRLGYATSRDGLHWDRRSEPLISDLWVEDMMIVRHQDVLFMFAEGLNDQAQLLRSSDGIHWRRMGALDVRLTNGQPIPPGPYGTPVAWFENNLWHLFYERRDAGVWLATSRDMKIWTNVSDDPVIRLGTAEHDRTMIAMNQVIRLDDTYIAVLHGTGDEQKPRRWSTWLATSSDLRNWTKLEPLRPASENKSSGVLVQDGETWSLFTMHDRVERHRPDWAGGKAKAIP